MNIVQVALHVVPFSPSKNSIKVAFNPSTGKLLKLHACSVDLQTLKFFHVIHKNEC